VLGLLPVEGKQQGLDVGPFVELLIQMRKDMRANKQYAQADQIRDHLLRLGVVLEDGPRGTTWKRR
jgi:cysteinyl-tRNA synthetase